MRILLVEDEGPVAERLVSEIEALGLGIEVAVARTRDAAIRAIEAGDDLYFIVCGLHLPASEGDDPLLEHGVAVYERAVAELPGTPTMLLTGQGDQRAARERIAGRAPADIFGVGEPYPMSDLLYKHEHSDYIERIAEVAQQFALLQRIEIQPADPEDLALSESHAQALRIFARRHGAKRVELLNLGGLSDSLAVRATLFEDDDRAYIAAVFAKLATLPEVAEEAKRYQQAALRLPAGSYAPLLDRVEAGAGRTGGLFYGLAERHPGTLFSYVMDNPNEATRMVEDLQGVLGAWRKNLGEPRGMLVSTLRRQRIASTDIEPYLVALDDGWRAFEAHTIAARYSLQHGDLHGANVLVGEAEMPLLIDFANVEERASCFDPVVLELSLLFHPQSPFRDLDWPSVSQCEQWDDLDAYLVDCPAADFVRACRRWALEASADPVTVYAVAYAEALRQLQYASNEAERALGIARAACRRGNALIKSDADGPRKDAPRKERVTRAAE
ncbi:MAG: phosphotransferase [Dehalococcoidia bacterium]|nr:phosphotransferase [Dehalococcoidia bacterium]